MPLKKEKFFEDFYQSQQDIFSRSILQNEQAQIKQILEKYSQKRLVQFEEAIRDQSRQKSLRSRDESYMRHSSSIYSRQFNRRVANIGESDDEYSSKCSQEMNDQIHRFPNSMAIDYSKNDAIVEFEHERSMESDDFAHVQGSYVNSSDINQLINLKSHSERRENNQVLQSQTKRLMKRNEIIEEERAELEKDIQN